MISKLFKSEISRSYRADTYSVGVTMSSLGRFSTRLWTVRVASRFH
jgi:hypothetical protein